MNAGRSNMGKDDAVNTLFTQFTRLRQMGWSRQQAWAKLEQQSSDLALEAREHLLVMLRDWEAKEGRKYPPTPRRDPFAVDHLPAAGSKSPRSGVISPVQPLTKPIPVAGSRIKRIGPAATSQSSPSSGPACPRCGMVNRPGEVFCVDCGAVLHAHARHAGGTLRLSGSAGQDRAYFGENMAVIFRLQDTHEMIRIVPKTGEMVIGRTSPDSVMIPDIDLSPYNGEALGVSRLHATLRRKDDSIVLTDMGSLNHTYINGQRVHAQEVRVVQDGDELQFGQLRANVYFEQG